MARSRSERAIVTLVGKWLLAVLVPASALAMGGVHPSVTCAITGVAAVSACLLWWDGGVRIPPLARWCLVAFGILIAATVVSLIPMPHGLLHAVSPATADIWDRALTPFREATPDGRSLSVAPTATSLEIVRLLGYVCVFLSVVRVTALEEGFAFVMRVVMASAALMALSALAHWAVSATTIFGVYRPQEAFAYRPGRIAPLLNTNHLAAYLNIGTCVALSALLAKRWVPRALSASVAILTTGTTMFVSSRGGTAALVLGCLLVVTLTYAKSKFRTARAEVIVAACCALAATAIVVVAMSETSGHLVARDLSKLDAFKSSWLLVREAPWLGYGRGSFETIFASVLEVPTYMVWTHAENIVAQSFVEWGIPVSVLAFAGFAWALRPQVLFRAVTAPIGVWTAVVITVLHDLVDYHLETPGVAVLATTCLALAVSGAARGSRKEDARTRSGRILAFSAALAGVVAAFVATPSIGHTVVDERRTLGIAALDANVPAASFRASLRAAMLRYPAEPFLPLMGAVRAQRFGDPGVLAWVSRALERNPKFGRAHLVLARDLRASHPAQARLEYRFACEYDKVLRDSCVREGASLVGDYFSALELVPEEGSDVLDGLVAILGPRLPSTAWELDSELARRHPNAPEPLRRRATSEVTDAISVEPWCDGSSCVDRARRDLAEWKKREPDRCGPEAERARLDLVFGDAHAALDRLEEQSRTVTDKAECTKTLVNMALAQHDARRVSAVLEDLAKGNCASREVCLDLYEWAAVISEGRREYVRAMSFWRRVGDLAPERDDPLVHIVDLGEQGGLRSEALDAYRTLASRHPEDPQWDRRANELRRKALDVSPPHL